jgi:hypothetical protein
MKNNFKRLIGFALIMFCLTTLILSGNNGSPADTILYYDGQLFTIIGKYHNESNYVRFPQIYQTKLRKEIWELGQHSAGISIRFCTNSSKIIVRWTVKEDNTMDHMPATGIKGIDLYAFLDGHWKYVNTGRVKGKDNEYTFLESADNIYREYLLNLPLYDGIETLSIGINSNAEISRPKEDYLIAKKPVVYYGSSIAQGGCASRPGMAYTNILERKLDRSFINMGFSGNGTFDQSVGEAMCEIDAALYVIDCNPNTKTELIYERAVELVNQLKKCRPEVPVLLVEGFYYENGLGKPEDSVAEKKRLELRRAYKVLQESGIQQIYYQKGDGMIGSDHEGTVDGVHLSDLGMLRFAEAIQPIIEKILK